MSKFTWSFNLSWITHAILLVSADLLRFPLIFFAFALLGRISNCITSDIQKRFVFFLINWHYQVRCHLFHVSISFLRLQNVLFTLHMALNALAPFFFFSFSFFFFNFCSEEMDLAVNYIDNLTKVSRFDLLIMCLASADKDGKYTRINYDTHYCWSFVLFLGLIYWIILWTDLSKLWDEVFCSEATPIEYAQVLDNLRSKYYLKRWWRS